MFCSQAEDQFLDGDSHFLQWHRGRNANVEEHVRAIRRAANAPGMSSADAADIHDTELAVVDSLFFPYSNPFINARKNLFQTED